MHIDEVVGAKQRKNSSDKKSDFEKNAARLRSKDRKLDAQKPIKPVSTN